MKCQIQRRKSTDYGTPGKLTLENGWVCDTLELPWRGNAKGVSCIKADTYRGWLWFSPTLHRWAVRLEDKHGRGDCLLHNGNLAGDASKGLKTQVHGCTEVGAGYGTVGGQYGILNSVKTLDELIRQCGGDPALPADAMQDGQLEVTYVWEPDAQPEDDR